MLASLGRWSRWRAIDELHTTTPPCHHATICSTSERRHRPRKAGNTRNHRPRPAAAVMTRRRRARAGEARPRRPRRISRYLVVPAAGDARAVVGSATCSAVVGLRGATRKMPTECAGGGGCLLGVSRVPSYVVLRGATVRTSGGDTRGGKVRARPHAGRYYSAHRAPVLGLGFPWRNRRAIAR